MPSGFTRRDLKTELLENLWQVAEHRRVDQNNVVLRSARRHFKTVKIVYTRQAASEPAPGGNWQGIAFGMGPDLLQIRSSSAALPPAARVCETRTLRWRKTDSSHRSRP